MEGNGRVLLRGGGTTYTLAHIIAGHGQNVYSISDALHCDKTVVMEWICGRIPTAEECIHLAQAIGCPLEMVYKAILNTPRLV